MYECRQLQAVMREKKNLSEGRCNILQFDMKKSEKYNSSGCLDLTAFQALKNIEREEAAKNPEQSRKKKKKKRRKSTGQ